MKNKTLIVKIGILLALTVIISTGTHAQASTQAMVTTQQMISTRPMITTQQIIPTAKMIPTEQTIPTLQMAKPEIIMEPGAKLLITEVNFKNKHNDWVKFYYESPTAQSLNLKGFQFQEQSVFKKIDQDYWLQSKGYYLLEFKKDEPDHQENHTLYTSHKGLTGTTSQIIIKDQTGKIRDALCWSNGKPTVTETKNIEKLFQNNGWKYSNPESCFSTTAIKAGQSVVRINLNDTDSANDWTLGPESQNDQKHDSHHETGPKPQPTAPIQQPVPSPTPPGEQPAQQPIPTPSISPEPVRPDEQFFPLPIAPSNQNTPTNISDMSGNKKINEPTIPQRVKNSKPRKNSKLQTPSPKKIPKSKSPKKNKKTAEIKKSLKKTQSKSKKQHYKTGDMSNDILISEIFPHPGKDQRRNEWIEITNKGNKNINLGNWQLAKAENGNKKYILPDTLNIPSQSAIIINSKESKLSLNDKHDALNLIDPEGKVLQTVEYEEAPKNQSYAWTTINKEDGTSQQKWLWENTPTPGEINPKYQELTGTITKDAEFTDKYHFAFQTQNGQEHNIVFNEALIAGPLAKATFRKETTMKILGIPATATQGDPSKPDEFILKKYEVMQSAPNQNQGSSWMLFGLVPPGGAGFWYGLRKLKKYAKI